MIEPVQGEGGFVVAPREFMRGIRRICDEHGIVLVVDEVQTGFGRTGRMFAIEHYGVEPDLMTVAKSIAAGLPLSGVIGKAEIMDAPPDSAIGGTYVGNPVAQAAALAVLDVIEEEGLVERAQRSARRSARPDGRLAGALRRDRRRARARRDARDRARPRPRHEGARAEARDRGRRGGAERGLLLLKSGIYSNCIRVLCRSSSPTPSSTRRSTSGRSARRPPPPRGAGRERLDPGREARADRSAGGR